jgi:hypothetical protein
LKQIIYIAGLLLVPTILTNEVKADPITFSFTGMDTATGDPITGSFTYNTAALANPPAPGSNTIAFQDMTGGNLTLMLGGKTYSNNAVLAILEPNSLQFSSNDPATGIHLGVDLAAANSGDVFANLSSLPATLNTNVLTGSTFHIGQAPVPSQPGGIVPAYIAVLASGPIANIQPVGLADTAPEPGTLLLAAMAAAGWGCVATRRAVRRHAAIESASSAQ